VAGNLLCLPSTLCLDTLFTSSDKKLSGFTRPHVIGLVADIFFSTLESRFIFFRIRCRIRRIRVDGSRIRKEKVADSKISGYVWTGPQLYSEKLLDIFEIMLQKYEMFAQKSLSFEINNSQILFCCLYVNLPDLKIWGQSDKFPLSRSSLQCPPQVKKLSRENSAKYVNQTGNFYFRPNVKPPFLCQCLIFFQSFLLYFRHFIWIITFTEKSKSEEHCRSEGIW